MIKTISNFNNIYLAEGLHKAKMKISDTVFHAWRNHRERLLLLQGFICNWINLWFGFALYTLSRGVGGLGSLAVMAAVNECSRKF